MAHLQHTFRLLLSIGLVCGLTACFGGSDSEDETTKGSNIDSPLGALNAITDLVKKAGSLQEEYGGHEAGRPSSLRSLAQGATRPARRIHR